MTNREWLESLSDEEVARCMKHSCLYCIFHVGLGVCTASPGYSCQNGIALWLQKEHKEKNNER